MKAQQNTDRTFTKEVLISKSLYYLEHCDNQRDDLCLVRKLQLKYTSLIPHNFETWNKDLLHLIATGQNNTICSGTTLTSQAK